jgi:hypothetical protein
MSQPVGVTQVCALDMTTAGPSPEAGKRAQNKHVQMRVSMFVWLTWAGGGVGQK